MTDHDNVDTNSVLATGLVVVALLGVLGVLLPPGLVDHLVERASEPVSRTSAPAPEQVPVAQAPASTEPEPAAPSEAKMPQETTQSAGKSNSGALRTGPATGSTAPLPAPAYAPPSTWYSPPQAPAYPAQPVWGGYFVPPYPPPYVPYNPYYPQPYQYPQPYPVR